MINYQVKVILEVLEGVDMDIQKRNSMENRVGQLLHLTFESHMKIGVKCSSLQVEI